MAKVETFSKEELGVFSEAMYIYLSKNFGSDYIVSEENCRVIDVMNMIDINYSMIKRKEIPSILNKIIRDLKKLL